jgi:low affinity Fe/Cu permease
MERYFEKFANATAKASGSSPAFLLCVLAVVVWAVSGPFFGFSETWQLVINTGTTIVTFLMVFLIQNTQNRDSEALQTKLDELIRSSDAGNEFMGIEKLTDQELAALHKRCQASSQKVQAKLSRVEKERDNRTARTT